MPSLQPIPVPSPSPTPPPPSSSEQSSTTSNTSTTSTASATASAPISPRPHPLSVTGPAHTALQNPTISSLIVSHLTDSLSAPPFTMLFPLLFTCKALQVPAERAFYRSLHLSNAQQIYKLCLILIATPRLASYVRAFGILTSRANRLQGGYGRLPVVFWKSVHDALTKMDRLESLVLTDLNAAGGNGHGLGANLDQTGDLITYVLPSKPPFTLKTARIFIPFDERMARFLRTQNGLKELIVHEVWPGYTEEFNIQYHAHVVACRDVPRWKDDDFRLELPLLESFEGPAQLAARMFRSPLRYLQVHREPDLVPDVLEALPTLATEKGEGGIGAGKTLKSLSLYDLSVSRSVEAIRLVGKHCPQVLHLGCFPMGDINRNSFHQALSALPSLISLELDLSSWHPQVIPQFQRAICAELTMYRPTLRMITIWVGGKKFVWKMEEEGSGLWFAKGTAPGESGEVAAWRSV